MNHKYWRMCTDCVGRGKKSRKLTSKQRHAYALAYALFVEDPAAGLEPQRPKASLYPCPSCLATGIVASDVCPEARPQQYPHVAIVGMGIAGVALAVACQHRGIPFTIYERDKDFHCRAQGYGLTLQQASRVLKDFGISTLHQGITSTRHIVHNTDGLIVGQWGARRWRGQDLLAAPKRANIHIARQALREVLLDQLVHPQHIRWGHQLVDISFTDIGPATLTFDVEGQQVQQQADLIVGADGIRSAVRSIGLGREVKPLRYLDCLVMLGICPLAQLPQSDLLDQATVFQTANGHERIYVMPFAADSVMWQLSFPMPEQDALMLSAAGADALRQEALRRTTSWHSPIPEIIDATALSQITGYPVYDRPMLDQEMADSALPFTLIGDAAHPMSPFKGQGANQALLDALALARAISDRYHYQPWHKSSLREELLNAFETDMLQRAAVKVQDSSAAAVVLHSHAVLQGGDQPRRALHPDPLDF